MNTQTDQQSYNKAGFAFISSATQVHSQ